MHTHIIPEKMPNFTEKFGYGDFISVLHHKPGSALMMKGGKFFREIEANCWDPEVRIEAYQQHKTQVQVISTIPVLFSYWADPKDGLDISMFLNDHMGEVVANYPENYIGLGTVPMQDIDMAIGELERLQQLGFPGVQIGSNINNQNLSRPRFFEFFEACERLDMAVLVHPWDMMGAEHMEKYWLPWLVGMPAETTRAITSMIFGGVFARYPRLRVCFAHAGGSFLATLGRIEHGFRCRPDLVAVHNNVNPREYIGKFWVDSITHDKEMFEYVMKKLGSEKVCLGSDYPFPLGDLEIGQFIEELGLDEEDYENVMYKSAMDWLGIGKAFKDDDIRRLIEKA